MTALINPRAKEAPYFDGKPRHIIDFLDDFDFIAAAANVTGQNKVNAVINYVSREVAELWKTYVSFNGGDWDAFKNEIIRSYPGIKSGIFTVGDLAELSRKQFTTKKIRTLDDLGKYHRKFSRIEGYLRTHQHLATAISNQYYWGGFRRNLREKIEDHLEKINPNRDVNTIASIVDIYSAAVRVLTKRSRSREEGRRRKRSARTTDSSDSDEDSTTNSSESTTDSSSDTSSFRLRNKKSRSKKEKTDHRKKHKKHKKSEPTNTAKSLPSVTSPQPSVKVETGETSALIQELMRQMNQQQAEQTKMFTSALNSLAQTSTAVAAVNRATRANYGCNFCGQPAHMMRDCLTMMKYLVEGKASKDSSGKLCTPTGIPIPPGETRGQTLQSRLDTWLAANPRTASTTVAFHDPLLDAPTTAIHFFEGELAAPLPSVESLRYEMGRETEDEAVALVESLANEAKKAVRSRKAGAVARNPPDPVQTANQAPPNQVPPSAEAQSSKSATKQAPLAPVPPSNPRPPRAKFVSQAEDPALQEEIIKMVLGNKIEGGITLRHLFAISPGIRSKLVEYLRTHRVETPISYNAQATFHMGNGEGDDNLIVSESAVPLREVPCTVGNIEGELAVLDEGSSIIVIREDLWLETGLPIQRALSMRMEGAHGDVASTLGGLARLPITLDKVTFYVRAQVVPRAPFRILLGRPFFEMTQSVIENVPGGNTLLTVTNPNPPYETITIPTIPRRPRCRHHHHQHNQSPPSNSPNPFHVG
jgi:hypothetical protein